MKEALKKDGDLHHPRRIAEIIREFGSLTYNIGPYLLRALLPWHNPRCEDDPRWMKDWISGHAALPSGALVPLVDTNNPDMPVPFPSREVPT
jgi:hypothetical protein